MPAYSAPTWVNGSTVPIDATHLQAVSNALAQAVQADGTGPNIAATLSMTDAGKLQGSVDTTAQIAMDLWGDTTSVGVKTDNRSLDLGSGVISLIRFNCKRSGGNDVFISAAIAYELFINAQGVQARKSTNAPSAGATITWGLATVLFS